MSCAAGEFRNLDLGDKRREARAVLLGERLADKPTASLPRACSGWARRRGPADCFTRRGSTGWICRSRTAPARHKAWPPSQWSCVFRTPRTSTSTASRSGAWGR
jgi:hypothetical protein